MDDDAPIDRRWPGVCARVAGAIVLAVALYVMTAPAVFYLLGERSKELNRALEQLYAPLDWVATHTRLLHPLIWYAEWWYRLPGGPSERVLRQAIPLPAVNDPGPVESIP